MTPARPDRRRPDPALQEVAGRAEGVAVIYPDTGRGAAHQLIPNMQQLTYPLTVSTKFRGIVQNLKLISFSLLKVSTCPSVFSHLTFNNVL